jgi:hypothetical protein
VTQRRLSPFISVRGLGADALPRFEAFSIFEKIKNILTYAYLRLLSLTWADARQALARPSLQIIKERITRLSVGKMPYRPDEVKKLLHNRLHSQRNSKPCRSLRQQLA